MMHYIKLIFSKNYSRDKQLVYYINSREYDIYLCGILHFSFLWHIMVQIHSYHIRMIYFDYILRTRQINERSVKTGHVCSPVSPGLWKCHWRANRFPVGIDNAFLCADKKITSYRYRHNRDRQKWKRQRMLNGARNNAGDTIAAT